jgi:glycerol-3-phosphate dehydrogenase (NAD(P)+)
VTILGAGAWGTTLARLLAQNEHSVTLWGHDAGHLQDLAQQGVNEQYLPGITLPERLQFEANLVDALKEAEAVVVAVPSKVFRSVTRALGDSAEILVSVTKGIEDETGLTMCGVLRANAPRARLVALSGPTLAMEVAHGMPAAIVAASDDADAAQQVQRLFHRPTFRVYTSADPLGVELGGALKNVVAIAAGVGDGLGFGDNSKGALITRGIVEIRRLGVACGAQAETFSGLSGLGDLAVTCYSKLSRNRGLGE